MRKMTIDLQEIYHALLDRTCTINQSNPFWIGDELLYQFEIIEDSGVSYKVTLSSNHEMED